MVSIIAEHPPLEPDDNGVIRVGGTRVTFDLVIEAFKEGLTAEEIAQQYPSLRLAHVYGAVSYYLNHTAELDDYLNQRKREAQQIEQQIESRFDVVGFRARLLARQNSEK